MNSGVSSLLVDTDVLAYAAVEQYQDHAAARSRIRGFRKQGCRLFISPQNLREFVAVLTKPKAFSIPLRRADVLAAAAGLTVRYGLLPEPPAVSMRLLDLLLRCSVTGGDVYDVNLVATALEHGIDGILTNNVKDFHEFSGLLRIVPLQQD